jgi:hypothetical protein
MSYSITEAQWKSLLARIIAVERHVNDLTVAQERLASVSQTSELQVVYESKQEEIFERMLAIEDRLNLIENIVPE